MHGSIAAIEYCLPDGLQTTDDLATMFPMWRVHRIAEKTGIRTRHIAAEGECASDLAVTAARRLFDSGVCRPGQVDFLLLCTQSPDYLIPTTACTLQHRLGIPTSAGALDFNLACSGYVYGLGLAEGLISSGQARRILLVTADTYSKYIRKNDRGCRTLFGDGATATLVVAREAESTLFGPFVYGTDGSGAENLKLVGSGTRKQSSALRGSIDTPLAYDQQPGLYMHGSEIFSFTVSVIPAVVRTLLDRASVTLEDIELFIFHQANAYILEELRRILGIRKDRFQIAMHDSANTVSSTIPIALKHAEREGRLRTESLVMLVGFGAGYSWAATIVRWAQP